MDSEKLLAAIDQAATASGKPVAVLLEVNISGDAAKHGWSADALAPVVAKLESFPHVKVQGLMTMAARQGDEQARRRNFSALTRAARSTPVGMSEQRSTGTSFDGHEW